MKKLHYLFFFCYFPALLYGQNKDVNKTVASLTTKISISSKGEKLALLDSLSKVILRIDTYDYDPVARETLDLALKLDSLDLFALGLSNYIYRKTNVDGVPGKGLEVYNQYSSNLKHINSKKLKAKIYIEHGFSHFISGNIDSSFYYYNTTAKYAQEAQDDYLLADAKVCLGEAYAKQGDFTEASQNLQEAAIAFRALKDTSKLIYVKKNITLLYVQSGFFGEAEKEIKESIQLSELIKDYIRVAVFNFFAAVEADRKGDQTERIRLLKIATTNSDKSKYDLFNKFRFLSALSIAYAENDSISKAKEVLNLIDQKQELMSPELNLRNRIYYVDAVKHIAQKTGKLTQARDYGEQSLAINTDRKAFEETEKAALFLSQVYQELGNEKKAFKNYRIHTAIKDSITSAQKTRSLAYYQTLYETEKKDSKIKEQESNLQVLEAQSKIRNQWFLTGGIIAVLLFIVFFVRNRYKRKIEKQKAVEKLRTKISADLHDDVGSLLTGLSMQSEILGKNAPEDIKPKLERVSELSRSAMLKMRDAVWVMDARKDNWQSLIDRINEFAAEHLGAKELNYNLKHTNPSNEEEIEGLTRQHLYLIVKEAITNILKHSNADTVAIDLSKNKSEIALSIKDNGMVASQGTAGLGVSNMKQRIEELSGKLDITTTDGYQINVKIPA